MASPRLRVSMVSRCWRSSAACDSASLAILSTSSFARPEEEVMVIFCSLLVALSLAATFKMPLASISKVPKRRRKDTGRGLPFLLQRPAPQGVLSGHLQPARLRSTPVEVLLRAGGGGGR